MKILRISKDGIAQTRAISVASKDGSKRYYALYHGETGRGRWQVQIPLQPKDFPVSEDTFPLQGEFSLHFLGKKDARGNPLFILKKGVEDGTFLILWDLSPGFRGSASFSVEGDAEVIASGYEAQGAAGRAGGAECPIVLVKGPCLLKWHRTGRLYGGASDWIARCDGTEWVVSDTTQAAFENELEW